MDKKHSSFPAIFQLKKNVYLVITWEIGGCHIQVAKACTWTEARNKAIWSLRSTVTMKPTLARLKKKCLLTYKFPWSLTKQLPFLSFPEKHVMFRGEEAEYSSAFKLQNNFVCLEFSFMKIQGFVPSSHFSVLLVPFLSIMSLFQLIWKTERKSSM
jgi:hypothetical protein